MKISQRALQNQRIERASQSRRVASIRNPKKNGFKLNYLIFGLLVASILSAILFQPFKASSNSNDNAVAGIFSAPEPTPIETKVVLELTPGELKEYDLNGFKLQNSANNSLTIYTNSNQKLVIKPTKNDIGKTFTAILENEKQDKTTYEVKVIQKELDFSILQNQIEEIIGDNKSKYGIYIKDLKRDKTVSLNPSTNFPPASISKVPIAIIALRDVQNGKYSLESRFPMRQGYKVYTFDGMSYIPNGTQLTLDRYISTMLKESDNTGMTGLEVILGGVDSLNSRFKKELGIEMFFRLPHDSKAEDIGMVFENIYLGKYLDKERNDYLLEQLFNTADRFDDRIVAGVPEKDGVKVAHKIGQITSDAGYTYNDAGIVYGEKTDFVIVVIDAGVGEADAREKIVEVTKAAYGFMNR